MTAIYEASVDRHGDEFGFVYVSCFHAVATSQLRENTRFDKSKISLVGSGYAGLGVS
jgi:hypothetical protein